MIKIQHFVFNPFQVNSFVLYDETNECVIIDAACYTEPEKRELAAFIDNHNLKPVHLLCTHGHLDHIFGNFYIHSKYKLQPQVHLADNHFLEILESYSANFGLKAEPSPAALHFIEDGEIIRFGNSELKAIHVPGHSPGGLAFHCEVQKLLFPGDIFFRESIGRSDLPGGNHNQLITGIKQKLLCLDESTRVFPGHNDETTIGYEKTENLFLK
jgi:hydroxyacylglutathione hydrolase